MKLKFVTGKHIPSQKAGQISKILNKVIKLYERGCFMICIILMDMEFKKVVEKLRNIEVDIGEAQEYIGEVKRKIIKVKECGIGIINTSLYSFIPSQIEINLI